MSKRRHSSQSYANPSSLIRIDVTDALKNNGTSGERAALAGSMKLLLLQRHRRSEQSSRARFVGHQGGIVSEITPANGFRDRPSRPTSSGSLAVATTSR